MPRITGPEMGSRLLAMNPDLRIVYMSGLVDEDTLAKWADVRDLLFLSKPFSPKDFLSLVSDTLARSHAA
jgi:FixJ family two-component response regulator